MQEGYNGANAEDKTKATSSLVRVEQAGILGLTSCEFDGITGEHLSTTRPRELNGGLTGALGIPGVVVDEVVQCPRFYKCDSCPKKSSGNDDDGEDDGKVVMTPEQLADAQHLHGSLFGWS